MGEHHKEFWKGKVVIGYAHPGSVRQEWHYSDLMSWIYDAQHDHHLIAEAHQPGLYIAGNRNSVVEQFLTTPAEWLWTQDVDHEYAPDTLYKLLEVADPKTHPIVSALYFGYMGGEPAPMWFMRMESGLYHTVADIKQAEQPQRVHCVGMGCCLIHRSVFEKIAAANFDPAWKYFGHDETQAHGYPERLGEDMTFFERCYKLDIPVYGDARIAIGHMKVSNLNYSMVKQLIKEREADEPVTMRVLKAVV